MAMLRKEQVEQKLQQLKQLTEEVNALTKELVEAGAIELSDEDLEKAAGGKCPEFIAAPRSEELLKMDDRMHDLYKRHFGPK